LYRKLEELTKTLMAQQTKCADLESKLNLLKESRVHRLHPYIEEAIQISTQYLHVKTIFKSPTGPNIKSDIFSKFGSDKDSRHSYSATYQDLLMDLQKPVILEIGLGTTNDYPYGGLPPGGSTRAWRSSYPNAVIVGADIDPESVKAIEEIGFILDQTSDVSLKEFSQNIKEFAPFDLIVDDGFHDPHANLRTLNALSQFLSRNGSYVIEDVHESLIDFWKLISLTISADVEIRDLREERPETDDNILIIFRNFTDERQQLEFSKDGY